MLKNQNEHYILENNKDFENEAIRKIVLHVYDDESKEFSSLTTYHGMVRIYNSTNWPSLIFWCLVVTICLGLFMIHSGYLVTVYRTRSTFVNSKHIRNNFPKNIKPVVTFCRRDTIYSNSKQNFSCSNFFAAIKIDNYHINCNDVSQYFYSQFGPCFTLYLPKFSFSNKLTVFINRTTFTELAFEVHDKESPSNLFAHGIHVLKGTHVMSQISVTVKQFLEKKCEEVDNDDGKIYTLEKCQQKCIKQILLKECHCLLFDFDCNKNDCIRKNIIKLRSCNCLLPCNRIHFSVREISMAKLPPYFANFSKITITFKDKTLIIQDQSQRLRTVDILSFVAGSMGLFLGMSCITLLEVFMYLFKAVWGTMNNARYKTYLSKLLGENVGNFLHADLNMDRSHEEIVITQTATSDNSKLKNLPPVTLQIKQSLTNQRLSIQIGRSSGDKKMLILPRQQRFYAHSHHGIFSTFNNSFETPTRNSLKQSFDYNAF